MSFLGKYQIVSLLARSETNTYRAQEILTGRPVLVHQFLRGLTSPHQPDLISLIYANLPGTGTPGTEHFLDSGEDGDQVFIVTSDVPECMNLRRWLLFIAASQGCAGALPEPSVSEVGSNETFTAIGPEFVSPPSPQPSVPPTSPKAEDNGPGEFTQMFLNPANARQQAPRAQPPSSAANPELKPPPAVKPPEKRPRGQVPSGFQVVFQSRKQAPHAAEPGPTIVLPPSSPEKGGPGEFTQMFSSMGERPAAGQPHPSSAPASVNPLSAAPSQPAVETDGPGEFTRMFSTPSHEMPEPAMPPTTSLGVTKPVAPVAPSGQEQPGEFTNFFLSPVQSTLKTMPPRSGSSQAPASPVPGSASRGPGEEHTSSPPSQSDSDGPGAFTRMFNTGGERSGGARSPLLGSTVPPTVPPSSTSKQGPGELTLLIQGYKPPPAAPVLDAPKPSVPPPAADSGKRAPGEFTMLFRPPSQSTASGSPTAPPPPVVHPVPPPPPQADQPGEYTRIFEAPRISPAPPQSAPPAAPPAGYGYSAAPPLPPAMPQPPQFQPPPPPAYPAAPPPPVPQVQPMAIPPAPAPQPAPPTGVKKPPMLWVMLIALGCLFLAAVVLVVFFALKH